ncbi:MAG: SUMF1/EgtB/PvdO family nonheme iron enzyme [Labilithrix sp.]|nr:SUMF1/EgtB/PvdO family nonheme iron enzyme [Labilithrix sp.]
MARAKPSRRTSLIVAPPPGARAVPSRRLASAACFAAAAIVLAATSCTPTRAPHDGQPEAKGPSAPPPPEAPLDAAVEDARLDAAARALLDATAGDASVAIVDDDPMKLHRETREELLSLFSIRDFSDQQKKTVQADAFLRSMFNTDGPHHANQGNKAIAQHSISRAKCLEGLKGVVIQTPEQREKCGAENMVPIWVKGKEAWFCIDVFEFPNKACELPMVWTQPPLAKKVCELQGKRLCSDIEWNIACRGDPEGGPDQRYAYGDKLDLEICHTNLRHRQACVVRDARTTWNTCTTDTEPSGSYPKCRSRFGVFDQHGNVAEVMMRRDGDRVVTQLKGSAWFYNELAKEPNEPVPATTTNKTGAYPDHCNFDPRWHVEQLDRAMHVNYHLGFRCCKSIP